MRKDKKYKDARCQALLCPAEPLHHSARHLSKLFAAWYPAPLLSLIEPPGLKPERSDKEILRTPQLQIQCHFQYKSTTTISPLMIHFCRKIPIGNKVITLLKRWKFEMLEDSGVSFPPTDCCIIGCRGPEGATFLLCFDQTNSKVLFGKELK